MLCHAEVREGWKFAAAYLHKRRIVVSSLKGDYSATVDFTVAVEEQLFRRKRSRKRGRRGGIRQRVRRRGNRPPLPSVVMGNVRSLRRKMEELRINAKVCYEYREAGIVALTETWLNQDIPDSLFELDGFSLVRSDRTELAGKCRGGIAVYIWNDWCTQFTVRERVCNPDLELLCLSLRPLYLPRKFGNIIFCVVYIPPAAKCCKISGTNC